MDGRQEELQRRPAIQSHTFACQAVPGVDFLATRNSKCQCARLAQRSRRHDAEIEHSRHVQVRLAPFQALSTRKSVDSIYYLPSTVGRRERRWWVDTRRGKAKVGVRARRSLGSLGLLLGQCTRMSKKQGVGAKGRDCWYSGNGKNCQSSNDDGARGRAEARRTRAGTQLGHGLATGACREAAGKVDGVELGGRPTRLSRGRICST